MSAMKRSHAQAVGAPAGTGRWWAEGLRLHGRGSLRFLGMPIYDAELAVADGFDAARPMATALSLRLSYRRALQGKLIADRSLAEMRRSGPIDEADASRWLTFMTAAFPDVKPGDTIRGDWDPATSSTVFQHNDAATARLKDASFGPRFFGIWLHEKTSEPALRAALLDGNAR